MHRTILDLQPLAGVAATARRLARSRRGTGVAKCQTMTRKLSFLAGLVVLLLAAAAEADRLLYVHHLAVYDATGRRIGSAWPISNDVWVGNHPNNVMVLEFRLRDIPVIVRFRADSTEGSAGFESDWLQFSQRGCTGKPLVSMFERSEPVTAVAGPRSTVYIQSGPIGERTVRSTRNNDGLCADRAPRTIARMVPLRATEVHLADHFVPPFTIETRARTLVPRVAP